MALYSVRPSVAACVRVRAGAAHTQWLSFCWHTGVNSILADEMGLGKTVQTVSLIHYLHTSQGIWGPFLVIAPLSTLGHWTREFEAWTGLNVVVYHGNAASRQVRPLPPTRARCRRRGWSISCAAPPPTPV